MCLQKKKKDYIKSLLLKKNELYVFGAKNWWFFDGNCGLVSLHIFFFVVNEMILRKFYKREKKKIGMFVLQLVAFVEFSVWV